MMLRRNFKRFFNKAIRQPFYAFDVLRHRLAAYLYYCLSGGRSAWPEAITLFLTHRCNLRCKMCGQWGEGGVTGKSIARHLHTDTSFNDMKALVDDISSFKPNITLFGGEPLLYERCIDLIKYIKRKKMHCLIITNGSLLEISAKDIVTSGLDELNVSLDGSLKLHDEMRGLPGLFERIMKGLEKIQRIKADMNRRRPLVNLQCTITKYNYEDLEQLPAVADRVGADSLTFHNLIFLNDKTLEKQKEFDRVLGCACADWEGFRFEPGIDPEALYNKITKILSAKHKFIIDFYPNFSREALMEYYTKSDYTGPRYSSRCISPWVAAYIFPDGEVRPCLNSNYSYGSVAATKFTQLWNNEKAVKFRSFLKEKHLFPVCARCTELYRY